MKNYWINSGLYTFLQRFSTLVFGFGGFYMLIRMQSKSEFGVWALVISVTALLEVARNGLIQNGLIKFSIGASENDQAQIQTAALFLNIALTIVSCIFLFFSGPYFETIWHASSANYLLKLYCLTSIALIPFQQFSYIQQAKFDFKGLFIMTLIRQGSFFFVILYYSINFHHIDLHDLGWWFLASAVLSSAAGFFIVIKSIGANYRTCLYDHIISQYTMIQDTNIWMDHTIPAYGYIITNKCTGHHYRSFPYLSRFTYQPGRWLKRTIEPHQLQVAFKRVIYDQQCFSFRAIRFFIDDNETGSRMKALFIIFRMINKYKITFLYPVYLIDASGHSFGITFNAGTDHGCDRCDRNRIFKTHVQIFLNLFFFRNKVNLMMQA